MPLPKQSENFPEWYNKVVLEAELAENSAVRGCMVIKPYGYAIWENMQRILDGMIKELEVENVYFPLLIPESFLKKEAEHVEGFAPEVAVVTYAGGKELEEKYVIRPTSETVMYDTFSRWIKSYRDLPLKVNQWANVMRWEMRTRLFLRTSEFLWQEGHTVHRTKEEAEEMMLAALRMYEKFAREYLAIDVLVGEKSRLEKFAGADKTTAIEGLMRDGKALQMGTSHNLGQNFAKSFAIKFLDEDNQEKYPWQTSWGVSTRLIGAIIMAHGDDKGLILPPKIAPYQVVVVPIYKDENEKKTVFAFIDEQIKPALEGVRLLIDKSEKNTPGWKFNHWELKGVPLRLEVGPKDVAAQKTVAVNRLDLTKKEIGIDSLTEQIKEELDNIHFKLYQRSQQFTKQHTITVSTVSQLEEKLEQGELGFYLSGWCGKDECERKIQATKATIRVIPFDSQKAACLVCGKPGKEVYIAKAY